VVVISTAWSTAVNTALRRHGRRNNPGVGRGGHRHDGHPHRLGDDASDDRADGDADHLEKARRSEGRAIPDSRLHDGFSVPTQRAITGLIHPPIETEQRCSLEYQAHDISGLFGGGVALIAAGGIIQRHLQNRCTTTVLTRR
jgi:hypothetical protein